MRRERLTRGGALLLIAGLSGGLPAGCLLRGQQAAVAVTADELPPATVKLGVFVYMDDDFVRRFGSENGAGRQQVNDGLWLAEYYMRAEGFPISTYVAGIDRWQLPRGALDGKAIFRKHAPDRFPRSGGADCMIALTGRERVYWSGVCRWPRIFAKAQAAEPVDEKTVSMLCHEISHWFGAKDIIDPGYPEPSVMNYKDKRFGYREGRIRWDMANRERMMAAFGRWPHE
jgi:hypothetical protein